MIQFFGQLITIKNKYMFFCQISMNNFNQPRNKQKNLSQIKQSNNVLSYQIQKFIIQFLISKHQIIKVIIHLFMEWECPICCQIQPISYQISECQHQFCMNCCVNHISEKSNTFNQILCPHVDCKKPFNKNPKIMNILPAKVLENIKSRERFMFISSNQHIKPCSVINCQGVIDMKQAKKLCDMCNTPHCPKCQKAFHEGPCLLNQQDKQMKVNGFQKCPHCSIWVQKKQGCNYVDCKCGTNFCYICGVSFNDDPCRLRQKWDLQLEIRRTIKKLQLKLPQQKTQIPKYLMKFPFKLIFFILYTLLLCVTGNFLLILAISLLCVLSPVIVIAASCTFQQVYIKILVIIFLPVLSAILIILILLIFTLYPLLRKTAHHGIYDGFDLAMNTGVKVYLRGLSCIF